MVVLLLFSSQRKSAALSAPGTRFPSDGVLSLQFVRKVRQHVSSSFTMKKVQGKNEHATQPPSVARGSPRRRPKASLSGKGRGGGRKWCRCVVEVCTCLSKWAPRNLEKTQPASLPRTWLTFQRKHKQTTTDLHILLPIRSPPSSEVSQSKPACPSSRDRGTVIRTETTPAWSTSGHEGTGCAPSQEPALPLFSQKEQIAQQHRFRQFFPGSDGPNHPGPLCSPSYTNSRETL